MNRFSNQKPESNVKALNASKLVKALDFSLRKLDHVRFGSCLISYPRHLINQNKNLTESLNKK